MVGVRAGRRSTHEQPRGGPTEIAGAAPPAEGMATYFHRNKSRLAKTVYYVEGGKMSGKAAAAHPARERR
jgi:hypothetical protein